MGSGWKSRGNTYRVALVLSSTGNSKPFTPSNGISGAHSSTVKHRRGGVADKYGLGLWMDTRVGYGLCVHSWVSDAGTTGPARHG